MSNFLDIDEQISQNKKVLEFYYNNYQRTQSKISVLIFFYSVIAIYLIPLIKFPVDSWCVLPLFASVSYLFLFVCFFIFLIISIWNFQKLLTPIEIAYLHDPEYYYKDIKQQYEKAGIENKELLNEYIKATYLQETEISVKRNSATFKKKSRDHFLAFRYGLVALLIYAICTAFVIFKEKNTNEVTIKNYKEILLTLDSIKEVSKNNIRMSDKGSSKESKPKIDPARVIRTEPRMIKEGFTNHKTKEDNEKSEPKSNKKGK